MPWLAFGVDDGPKKTFQRLNSFFWLVGRSCNASIRSRGEKHFSACEQFFFFPHISSATAFGWGLGSIALACHGFASAGAVTLGSALSPLIPPLAPFWMSMLCKMDGILPATGNIPNVPQGTSPKGVSGDLKHSQVWLRQHSQSHGTLVQCSLALSQMLWPKKYAKKKLFTGWKVFPLGTG